MTDAPSKRSPPRKKRAAPKSSDGQAAVSPTKSKKRAPAKTPSRRPDRELVLVTGAAGGLGRLLCRKLHRTHDVLAVDRRPFPDRPKDVEHHRVDLRRKAAYDLFKKRKPSAIVHMGLYSSPLSDEAYGSNLEITSKLLRFAERTNISKFVLLSTANLYGPSATSAGFLSEESPLLAAGRSPEVRDLIGIDMMVQSFFWKRPDIETVILRPVHIVGPHLTNAPSKYFRLRRIPTVLGFDPMVQLIHESDIVDGIINSLRKDVRGVFNIVGPGQAPLSRLIRVTGHKHLPIPGPLFDAALSRMFSLHMTTFPATELDHLRYSCLVDGSRANTALSFAPARGLKETILDV